MSVHEAELLPPLYSPQLVAVGSDALLFRGFESDGGTAYVGRSGAASSSNSGRDPRRVEDLDSRGPDPRRARHGCLRERHTMERVRIYGV